MAASGTPVGHAKKTTPPASPCVPLLQRRGLQLLERGVGNFALAAYPGLLVKENDWRWSQRNLAGKTIDFFVQVLGLSFHMPCEP